MRTTQAMGVDEGKWTGVKGLHTFHFVFDYMPFSNYICRYIGFSYQIMFHMDANQMS